MNQFDFDESEEEILSVSCSEEEINAVDNYSNKILATMKIGGKDVKMLIDSGASCNVLPIKNLPKGTVVETYKCIHGMAPYYLTSKFCNRASIHGRKTRNCDQLQIPLYTSAARQRSFKFRGAKIWNSLDTDLKEHKSLKNFKLALKSRLFSNLYK